MVVVACDDTVLVAKAGQEPLTVSVEAWRQLLADVKAGRWDRPR